MAKCCILSVRGTTSLSSFIKFLNFQGSPPPQQPTAAALSAILQTSKEITREPFLNAIDALVSFVCACCVDFACDLRPKAEDTERQQFLTQSELEKYCDKMAMLQPILEICGAHRSHEASHTAEHIGNVRNVVSLKYISLYQVGPLA